MTLSAPPAVLDQVLQSHDQRGQLCIGSTNEVEKCVAAMQGA